MSIKIIKTVIPKESDYQKFIKEVDYSDTFKMVVKNQNISIENIYIDMFSSMPKWINKLMNIRNKLVSIVGLKVDSLEPKKVTELKIGEKVGMFTIYAISKNEVIAGEDDKHLDFRVSVLRVDEDVMVSTFVKYNNLFGKVYMSLILPFHKVIVKAMMKNYIKNSA
jgi:hypothetical protein